MTTDVAPPAGQPCDSKEWELSGLLTRKRLGLSAAVINSGFVLYLLLSQSRAHGLLLTVLYHVLILAIVFVIPGTLTTFLFRRRYYDAVHFGVLASMWSSGTVLGLKLLLNIVQIPISALSFSLAILLYSNACIAWLIMKNHGKSVLAEGTDAGQEESTRPGFSIQFSLLTVVVALLALFTFMEYISGRLGPIDDTDQASFGAYSIMERSVPVGWGYEESRSAVYPNYTPYLIYNFSHPPLAAFNTAYVAALDDYLRYGKLLEDKMYAYYYEVVESGKAYLTSEDFKDIGVERGFLNANRASSHYHVILLCLFVFAFCRRLTGKPWIAVAAMLSLIGMFWSLLSYAVIWLCIYKSVFLLYSLAILYAYLFWPRDNRLAFMLGVVGGLASQKVVYVIVAILAVELVARRWRVVLNPHALGFATGTLTFIVYGLLIDARVFVSNYFVLHLYDRLTGASYFREDVLLQWRMFIGDIIGAVPFAILALLSLVFLCRHFRSRKIVIFVFFVSAAFLGSRTWPYVFRFLTPMVLPMVLMSSVAISDLFDLLPFRRPKVPERAPGA
jgi:hypothetical protein